MELQFVMGRYDWHSKDIAIFQDTDGGMMKGGWELRFLLGAVMVGATMLAGCEDKDGNDAAALAGTGRMVVWGNFLQFGDERVPGAVAGASIRLEGTDIEMTADAEGRFRFTGVPAGTYTAVFELDGIDGTLEIVVKEGYTLEIRSIKVYEDGTVDAIIIYHPLDDIIDVSGSWIVQRQGAPIIVPTGLGAEPMTLEQNGRNLSGMLGLVPVSLAYNLHGSINGHGISLTGTFPVSGPSGNLVMTGTVNTGGTSMSGTWDDGSNSGTWTAERGTLPND